MTNEVCICFLFERNQNQIMCLWAENSSNLCMNEDWVKGLGDYKLGEKYSFTTLSLTINNSSNLKD